MIRIQALCLALLATPALCQEEAPERRLVVEPASLELAIGDSAQLRARVVDADGQDLDEDVFFFSRSRDVVAVDREGLVKALQQGSVEVVVRTRRSGGAGEGQGSRRLLGKRLTTTVNVTVAPAVLTSISLELPQVALLTGTSLRPTVVSTDVREETRVVYCSLPTN